MEEVFSTILKSDIALVAAGRTDAGVHARQMIAHFDTEEPIETAPIIAKINAFLPEDIAVQDMVEVARDAHARFGAAERTYEYWIVQQKNPFYKDTAYYVRQPLDVVAMNQAAQLLLQYEDFESFSKSRTDVKTFKCNIKNAGWTVDDHLLIFTITADRFLRNMVRAIVGTLLEVGMGKIEVKDVNTIIKSKDRGKAGPSVPAKGLYLTKVTYPRQTLKVNG